MISADDPGGSRPPPSPLGLPAFRWLWLGALVSLAGTHMQFVALPYFIYEQTGSSFATALTAAAQVLPGITLGPVAGALADRRDSRRLLISANLVLAAVTLAFCLALVAPWWVVVVVAFVQAVVAQLVAPAEVVLVPSLVPSASLAAANSLSAANNSLARLIGPAAGGLLYAVAGLPTVAVTNAVSFAVAAVLVSRVVASTSRSASAGPARTRDLQASWLRLTQGWPAGWTEIRSRALLGRLLVFVVLTSLGEGFVSALLVPYVAEVFGSSTTLGLLLTCQALGGVVGAVIVSRHSVLDRLPSTLGAAAIVCGVLLAVMIAYPLLYPQLWPTLVLITVAGLPFAAVAAAQTTLLQILPSPAARGSVFGVTVAAAGAAQLVGILVAGYLADRLTVYVLLVDAPCYLIAGLVILDGWRRTSARTRRTQTRGLTPERRISVADRSAAVCWWYAIARLGLHLGGDLRRVRQAQVPTDKPCGSRCGNSG